MSSKALSIFLSKGAGLRNSGIFTIVLTSSYELLAVLLLLLELRLLLQPFLLLRLLLLDLRPLVQLFLLLFPSPPNEVFRSLSCV